VPTVSGLNPELSRGSFSADFPRLHLKYNEKARVFLIEAATPHYEWIHYLRKPKIVDGAPVPTTRKLQDGTVVPDWEMDFGGAPICLGDADTLEDAASDPKNCPVCEAATKSDLFLPPQRKFAMNVMQYITAPNSYDVQEPFRCQTRVWRFSDRIYGKLADLAKEWGNNLKSNDLCLKCISGQFQTYEMTVARDTAWNSESLAPEVRARRAKELLDTYRSAHVPSGGKEDNGVSQLMHYCGRVSQRAWILGDIAKVNQAWDQLYRWQAKQSGGTSDLDSAGMLATAGDTNPVSDSSSSLLGELFPEAATNGTPAAGAVQSTPAIPDVDFDAMLSDLES
jgi:hypothetical protein